jgi:hydrogenase nickel incorporation protein HypB
MASEPDNLPIPGLDDTKQKDKAQVIVVEQNILRENEEIAQQVRCLLAEKHIYACNLISSPGSGKTSLLVETLRALKGMIQCAVIEGDQQTSNDAQRIAQTGVPVVQVNTLQSCHMNADQVLQSLQRLPLDGIQLLFIENVGNLICPAGMDLGENEKVVLMSITEGEDKPAKYPLVFHQAHVLLLTKMDLLPHLRFDLELCKQYVKQVNPSIQIIQTSVYDRQGLDEWLAYLEQQIRA